MTDWRPYTWNLNKSRNTRTGQAPARRSMTACTAELASALLAVCIQCIGWWVYSTLIKKAFTMLCSNNTSMTMPWLHLCVFFYWCTHSRTLTVSVTESESWLSTRIHKMTDPTTQQLSYPSRRASSLQSPSKSPVFIRDSIFKFIAKSNVNLFYTQFFTVAKFLVFSSVIFSKCRKIQTVEQYLIAGFRCGTLSLCRS
jgi:hypothetical protein